MAKKLTNFDIVDYVHLSYANAIKDNRIIGGGQRNSLNSRLRRNYSNLEKVFTAEVGVSSKEFLASASKYSEALLNISKMFRCSNLSEMKEYISPEKIAQLNLAQSSADSLLASAQAIGYTELLSKVYTGQNPTILNELTNISNGFEGLNLYKENLKYLSSSGQDAKKEAMMLALLEKALENADIAKEAGKESMTITGNFNWQEGSYDNFHRQIQDFKKAMSNGMPVDLVKVNKLISSTKGIMDRDIKGKVLSKSSSGILVSKLGNLVSKDLVAEINKQVTKTPTKTININIAQLFNGKGSSSLISLEDGLAPVAKGIQKFSKKSRNFKINVNYNSLDKSIGVITKQYKASAKKMVLVNNITIGQALAYTNRGNSTSFTGNSKLGGQFYNAFNFFLLGQTFGTVKKPEVAEVIRKGPSGSFVQVDAAFGGVMSKFLMDLVSEILSPQTSAFIDINGAIIPTPVYYKFLMDNMTKSINANSVSSYISFNAQAFAGSVTSEILDPGITGARTPEKGRERTSWRIGYEYDIAALKRNILVKDRILKHTIGIRGDIININDYKNLIK